MRFLLCIKVKFGNNVASVFLTDWKLKFYLRDSTFGPLRQKSGSKSVQKWPERLFSDQLPHSQLRFPKKQSCEKLSWYFSVSLLKKVLLVLTNQAKEFILHGIGCSCFSRNLLLSFLLLHNLKILVKSRRGGIFLCLASSVNF